MAKRRLTIADVTNGRRFCFADYPTMAQDFTALVIEDEAGYYLADSYGYSADERNAQLGISKDTASKIIASSMRAGHVRKNVG